MAAPMRWIMFFSILFFAGVAIFALWAGLSTDLLKAVVSFAILMLAGVALYGVGRKAS